MGTDLGIGSILTGLYDHIDRYAEEIVIAETRVKHVETMLRQAKEILELRRTTSLALGKRLMRLVESADSLSWETKVSQLNFSPRKRNGRKPSLHFCRDCFFPQPTL